MCRSEGPIHHSDGLHNLFKKARYPDIAVRAVEQVCESIMRNLMEDLEEEGRNIGLKFTKVEDQAE